MTIALPSRFRRRIGTSVAVIGGLAILHFGSAGGLAAMAADVWDYPTQVEELAQDERRTAELDERMAVAAVRTEYRAALHGRMLTGQVTLRAAVAEYRAVVGPDAEFDSLVQAIAAGSDDTERVANYLLTSLVRGRPVEHADRARLAAEFRAEFGREPAFRAGPKPYDVPVVAGPRVRSS